MGYTGPCDRCPYGHSHHHKEYQLAILHDCWSNSDCVYIIADMVTDGNIHY